MESLPLHTLYDVPSTGSRRERSDASSKQDFMGLPPDFAWNFLDENYHSRTFYVV
jgi:hypothetical protein